MVRNADGGANQGRGNERHTNDIIMGRLAIWDRI